MSAVHQLKYKARLSLAKPLGRMLQAAFRQHWMQRPVDLVLPVPLHRLRLRQRGYNQVKLILDAWQREARRCSESQLTFAGGGEVLARIRATLPQAGQSRRARRRNMRGAFSVVDSKRVERRHVLLVDDVYTTGATVEEASRCLMRAGALSVEVLTLARTMPWRSQADCFPLSQAAGLKGV
jgi:ComF family protein